MSVEHYPEACEFHDVCYACGLNCNGLPCDQEKSWKRTESKQKELDFVGDDLQHKLSLEGV